MRAMVLAAGLGTRLRPLTYETPKPLVPVANRPMMDHVLEMLRHNGITEIVANLSYLPEQIREHYGDGSDFGVDIQWSFEERLLGTAGGVRKVRDFFGDESFLVLAADALTDIDLDGLLKAHRGNEAIATLTVKRVADTREYGVVVTAADGRIQGFQEKPHPDEALADVASCMIYVFEPAIFDYFPDREQVDFALDVFPEMLANDVPFYVHETDAYWNDVGSLDEYRQGNFDAVSGALSVGYPVPEIAEGIRVGDGTELPDGTEVYPPLLIGERCRIGDEVELRGPLVIGDGCEIGSGSSLRDCVMLRDVALPERSILVGAIAAGRDPAG